MAILRIGRRYAAAAAVVMTLPRWTWCRDAVRCRARRASRVGTGGLRWPGARAGGDRRRMAPSASASKVLWST
jgi:hypothetical protein